MALPKSYVYKMFADFRRKNIGSARPKEIFRNLNWIYDEITYMTDYQLENFTGFDGKLYDVVYELAGDLVGYNLPDYTEEQYGDWQADYAHEIKNIIYKIIKERF